MKLKYKTMKYKILLSLGFLGFTFFGEGALAVSPQWKQLPAWKAGENGPGDREHPLFFIHPSRPDEAILYGGLDYSVPQAALNDLWSLNLKSGKWRRMNQQGTSPGPLARVSLDGWGKEIIATGGLASDGQPSPAAYVFSLKKNAGVWTRASNVELPRYLHSIVAIPRSSDFLSFGGIALGPEGATITNLLTVVSFSRSHHQPVLTEALLSDPSEDLATPAPRYGFPFAFDPRNNRMVVSVGQGLIGTNEQGELVNQQDDKTFAFEFKSDGSVQWRELKSARLAARRNACWAVDSVKNHLYVFGGTADGKTALPGLYRLNLNDLDPQWQEVIFPTSTSRPLARSSCVGIFDSHRNRLLFGFGNILDDNQNQVRPLTDIWSLEL